LAISVLVLAALTLIGVGWARLSTNTSTLARALIWMEADVGDQHRFPAGSIPAGGHASALPVGPQARIWVAAPDAAHGRLVLDDVLRDSDTRAFVVVDHGRIVYQRYYEGSDERTLETSFSVAKSFVSTLVGIAIDEGRIGDVRDPVTDYIPELAARDPHFERISLRDLLTMSSGLRYEESPFPLPWGDDTYTYYGVDLRKEALQRTEIEHKPGENWHYNNYNALLLGLVLERATGMSVRDYMASRLWRPLGAASNASWSLDSDRSGFEKMESGLNATALDYARFGLLWLHGGSWNHNRILPRNWVDAATRVQTVTDYDNPYDYFWWIDGEYPQRFYAFGNYGQYVYVAPDAGLVVVRLGSDWGLDNDAWLRIFRDLADNRDGQPGSSPLASEAVWTWAPTAAEIR